MAAAPVDGRAGRPGANHGRVRAALTESVVVVLVLVAFTRLHALVARGVQPATENAAALQDAERAVHLDVELAVNGWLAGHEAFIAPAVLFYRLYYVVLLGVVVWVFVRHGEVYHHVRRTFVAMCGIALLIYWAVPMSPPRFAQAGSVDVVAEHDLWGSHGTPQATSYTAMPSVHVGWSAWAAYAVWYALRRTHPRAALLAWLFPLLMTLDVIATGNHYVLDVVGSVLLLLASIAVARAWDRLAARDLWR